MLVIEGSNETAKVTFREGKLAYAELSNQENGLGAILHSNNVIRALTLDQDVVDARLEKRRNTILLKITRGGGEWEFTLRIADRQDKPLDLTQFKGPRRAKV